MAKQASKFNFNVGYIYVAELLGVEPPVYKVGKTETKMPERISAPSTFAPFGIRVHHLQQFLDMDAAETNVHRRLRAWHRPKEIAGQATETFSASLETIYTAINEELAMQKEFAKECDVAFDSLRTNGFLTDSPNECLDDLMRVQVMPKLTLKSAIIRCLNSTSHEEKLCMRLLDFGIDINRRARIAKVACGERLAKLCPSSAQKRSLSAALENMTHFNSSATPIFA